jgi:hypothetical protein
MPAVLTGSIESSVGCTAGSSRENPEKNVDDAIRRHGDEAADALGVTRKHVAANVHGRAPVTPDMAVRLAGVMRH